MKILKVEDTHHKKAKEKASLKGMSLQGYIKHLIEDDKASGLACFKCGELAKEVFNFEDNKGYYSLCACSKCGCIHRSGSFKDGGYSNEELDIAHGKAILEVEEM